MLAEDLRSTALEDVLNATAGLIQHRLGDVPANLLELIDQAKQHVVSIKTWPNCSAKIRFLLDEPIEFNLLARRVPENLVRAFGDSVCVLLTFLFAQLTEGKRAEVTDRLATGWAPALEIHAGLDQRVMVFLDSGAGERSQLLEVKLGEPLVLH